MDEIKELEKKVVCAQRELWQKKEHIAEEIRKKHPILFGINAIPSDTRHVPHILRKCVFTTREKAQKLCTRGSYDMDDNIHWSYEVIPLDPAEVCVDDLLNLDKNRNSDFPYSGW